MIDRIASLLKMQKPLLNRGFLFASGPTVPENGSDGYQTGCVFQHTDGVAGETVYINNGSVTSSLFDNPEGGDTLTLAELADVADGFATRILETGTYASTADSGVVLSAANPRPFSLLYDDGGVTFVAGSPLRGMLSRILLSVDQTSSTTINAVRGQIKAINLVGITNASSVTAPVSGYLELDGTGARTINGYVACVRAALEEGASGTTTVGTVLSGFMATLNSSRTYAGGPTGVLAAYAANISNGTSKWQYGLYLEDSAVLTTGVRVGSCVTGIDLAGTYTGNALDFSNATIDPTGSNGPCFIRAGTYATPIDYGADNDQSGMIRMYSTCSGDISSYDRGAFLYCETTGAKGAFPIAGLAEANNTGTGPKKLQAGQFIAHLGAQSAGAHLATAVGDATAGLYGIWAKVAASGTAVCDSGSKVAAIWCDNQMSGTISGDEWGIFATTGASRPDAFIGFNTSSSGYDQLLSFDSTFDSGAGTCVTTDAVSGSQDARMKVWYDGTQYYIALYK